MSKHRSMDAILADLRKKVGDSLYFSTYPLSLRTSHNFRVAWGMETLTGCCGVAVIYQTRFTGPQAKDRKVRALVTEYQEAYARSRGYGAVISTHTTRAKTYQQARIDRGYVEAAKFRNPNSGNTVTIDVIQV